MTREMLEPERLEEENKRLRAKIEDLTARKDETIRLQQAYIKKANEQETAILKMAAKLKARIEAALAICDGYKGLACRRLVHEIARALRGEASDDH